MNAIFQSQLERERIKKYNRLTETSDPDDDKKVNETEELTARESAQLIREGILKDDKENLDT